MASSTSSTTQVPQPEDRSPGGSMCPDVDVVLPPISPDRDAHPVYGIVRH